MPLAPRLRQSPGRCLLKEAALSESGPRAAGSGGPHGAVCDRDPRGWEKAGWAHLGSPCVLAGTVASLRDGPRGQGAAERAKGRRLGVRVGLSWPAGPWLGGAGAVIAEVQDPLPQYLPSSTYVVFNTDFLYLPPQSSQGRGPEWGTGHTMLVSKGTVHRQTEWTLACRPRLCSGQLSPPMDAG